MSAFLSFCPFLCLPLTIFWPFICLPICLFVFYPSFLLSVTEYVLLSGWLSFRLSLYISAWISVCSVCPSSGLPFCLFMSLYQFIYIYVSIKAISAYEYINHCRSVTISIHKYCILNGCFLHHYMKLLYFPFNNLHHYHFHNIISEVQWSSGQCLGHYRYARPEIEFWPGPHHRLVRGAAVPSVNTVQIN